MQQGCQILHVSRDIWHKKEYDLFTDIKLNLQSSPSKAKCEVQKPSL